MFRDEGWTLNGPLFALLAALGVGGAVAEGGQAAQATPQAQTAPVAEGNKSAVAFYGFARLDAVFDDSRINSFQAPLFVRPEPPGAEDRHNFTMYPRLTRLGLNFRAPTLASGARVTGRIEIDFHNGGSNSRGIPRFRHVFLQVQNGFHAFLAGQTSDVISPLFPTVNSDTLMWNTGNLGDRRPQVRYSYGPPSGLNFQAAAGLTGAVDSLDADNDGISDGEAAAMPNLQARVGYTALDGRVLVGAWTHYARFHTATPIGGEDDFGSRSFGGDFDFRVTPRIAIRAEAWTGTNLGDVRGGVGQSFNTATGADIDSRGGWVEVGFRPGRYSFSTGYTMDDPEDDDVLAAGQTRNSAWYVTNQYRVLDPVTVGADYTFWKTEYKAVDDGTDNRINLYVVYVF
jgi:hypothetical protein